MGSIPNFHCSFLCCSKNNDSVPKSDLFIPQFDAEDDVPKKNNKKKLLKTTIINKKKLAYNRITTERFILSKPRIRNSYTVNSKRVLQNEKKELNRNMTLNTNNSNIKINNDNDNNNKIVRKKNNHKTIKTSSKLYLNEYSKSKTTIKKGNQNSEKQNPNDNLKFEITQKLLSQKEELTLSNIILYHYLFHKITKENLAFILKEIKEFQIEENSQIFCEGDEGSCMFIIKTGKVKLTSKNTKKSIILNSGRIFGELALMKDEIQRTYDAIAETDLCFYSFDKVIFSSIKDNFIERNPFDFALFKSVENKYKNNLEVLTTSISFKENQVITDLNGLFWVRSGKIILCDLSGEQKDIYETGEFLGIAKYSNDADESSLETETKIIEMDQEKSEMKIIAKENVQCTVIPSFAFIEVFGVDFKNKLYNPFFKETIIKGKYLKELFINNPIKEIAKLFSLKEYRKNDRLYHANNSISDKKTDSNKNNNINVDCLIHKLMIIVHGIAYSIDKKTNIKKEYKTCEILGEELFYGGEIIDIFVESNHLIALECSWNKFKEKIKLLNCSLEEAINELNSIYFFHGLKLDKLINIANNITIELYNEGDIIIKSGDKIEYVYFIKEGTLNFIEDEEVFKEYHKGNSFGEIFILNGKPAKGEIIVISEKCTLYKITKQFFFELLSDPKLNKRTKRKLCLEDMEIFPSHLYYLATIHKGYTNNIYLVHNKIYVYALKAIYIQNYYQSNTFECKVIPNGLNEKCASKILDNPFLIHYVKTLKNSNWCFFLEEYINGMTLEEYIHICKPFFSLLFCKFQSSCFMLMLETLKNIGLVHRNIKPENIILDKNGYPTLIGFSFCKRIIDTKTKTLIGTPHFMAPEILKGRGYSYSCDYWSVGICIYFLYYGEFPFGHHTDNPNTIYKEIINKEIEFKHNKLNEDFELKELINQLLNKDEKLRFCSLDQIKELNFYKNIDFDKLSKKEVPAPLSPALININYEKELNNLRIHFNDFIQNEIIETKKHQNSFKDEFIVDKHKDDFDHHKNIMKWYDKF